MRVSTPLAVMGLLSLVTSCKSTVPLGAQCSLTITLASRAFETALEVNAKFGPEWLSSVVVLEPGPRVIQVEQPAIIETGEPTTIETVVAPRTKGSRLFMLDTGLWTSAWDQVVWRDPEGFVHIPPGWYKIQVVYLPPGTSGNSATACVATSVPFQVRREALGQEEEARAEPRPAQPPNS